MFRGLWRGSRSAAEAPSEGAVIELTVEPDEATPATSIGEVRMPRRGVGELLGALGTGAFLGWAGETMFNLGQVRAAVAQANEYWGAQMHELRYELDQRVNTARMDGQTVGAQEAVEHIETQDAAARREAKEIARTLNMRKPYYGAALYQGTLREQDPALDPSEWTDTPYPLVLAASTDGNVNYLGRIRAYANDTVGVEVVPFNSQTMMFMSHGEGQSPLLLANLQAQASQNSGPEHTVVYGWDQSGVLLPQVPGVEYPASMK